MQLSEKKNYIHSNIFNEFKLSLYIYMSHIYSNIYLEKNLVNFSAWYLNKNKSQLNNFYGINAMKINTFNIK